MKTMLVIAIIVSAVTLASSQTHTRYLPVGAGSRRYLPTGRSGGSGSPPTRSQSPRRQAEPTAQYLPPLEDDDVQAPANRAIADEISGPYPALQPQREYQPEGLQRPGAPPLVQDANRRNLPTFAGTPPAGRGQSRGQKTYLPPSAETSGSGGSGLASYDFEYRVEDAASGNSFGHRESRRGEMVTGGYRVLLPDGRTQVVDYVADQEGYKPKVTYEGNVKSTDGGNGGYRYKRYHRH